MAHFTTPGTEVKGVYLDHPFAGVVISSRTHTINRERLETTVALLEEMKFLGNVKAIGDHIVVATDHAGNPLPEEYGRSQIEAIGPERGSGMSL